MGVDKIHLIKLHGIITNIQNNTVVELPPSCNIEAIMKCLAGLEGKEEIAYIPMGIRAPYCDTVLHALPNTKID